MKRRYNAAVAAVAEYMPEAVTKLPIDNRGYPVPWFVASTGPDLWDFRAIKPGAVATATKRHLCWICGTQLHDRMTFTVGPMCIINRISAEPPSHLSCARFACKACPFLANPKMRRNVRDLPEHDDPSGIMIDRNPGVTALWVTSRYRTTREGLFIFAAPTRVEWWAEGRVATRAEVIESIRTGMPLLEAACNDSEDPAAAHDALRLAAMESKVYLPKEVPT